MLNDQSHPKQLDQVQRAIQDASYDGKKEIAVQYDLDVELEYLKKYEYKVRERSAGTIIFLVSIAGDVTRNQIL